jgi:putative membrane protein
MNGQALWLMLFFGVLIWSGIAPMDYFTWFLEVSPALLGFVVLVATARKFPLTPVAYVLILVHSLILMVGGHYTYAEVPLFDWLRDVFHWQRNNYDKVGHFAQGFVPAVVAREVLLRLAVVNGRAWLNFLIVCFVLALSALYELFEWAVAEASGDSAVAFLATQGDPWDTQSDMALALIGAILALAVAARLHDRQLQRLPRRSQGCCVGK